MVVTKGSRSEADLLAGRGPLRPAFDVRRLAVAKEVSPTPRVDRRSGTDRVDVAQSGQRGQVIRDGVDWSISSGRSGCG